MPLLTINVPGLKPEDKQQLNRIEQMLIQLLQLEDTESMTLKALAAQVAKNTEIEKSAVLLITGIAQQLRDALNDPAAIQALADQLEASGADLAAAITANTTPPAPAAA